MPVLPAVMDSAHRGRPAQHPQRSHTNPRCRWGLWILGVFLSGVLSAAEPPITDQAPASPAAVQAIDTLQPESKTARRLKAPPTPQQKRKVIVLTSLMIAGIMTILLCLFLWIFWWSRRTHRLLRAPLPTANRGDELWYLKTKRFPNQTANRPTPDSPPNPPPA